MTLKEREFTPESGSVDTYDIYTEDDHVRMRSCDSSRVSGRIAYDGALEDWMELSKREGERDRERERERDREREKGGK